MIGSWFPQSQSTAGAWAWEVVAADGTVAASGVAADEQSAGWDCRIALFVARSATEATDIADLRQPVTFGGRWTTTAA